MPKQLRLKRTLGLFDAFFIGLGAIIGAGIFVAVGVAAGLAGPGLLVTLRKSACPIRVEFIVEILP